MNSSNGRTVWQRIGLCLAMAAIVAICRAQDATSTSTPSGHMTRRALADFAIREPGDVTRGRLIFSDEAHVACTKCHTTNGHGGKAGPDLGGIGDKFQRRDLIRSILEPSSTIAIGYSSTILEMKDGASR